MRNPYAGSDNWPSNAILARRIVPMRMSGLSEREIGWSVKATQWRITRVLRAYGFHIILPSGVMPYFLSVASAARLDFTDNEAQKAGAHAVNGEVAGWWSKDCPVRFRV